MILSSHLNVIVTDCKRLIRYMFNQWSEISSERPHAALYTWKFIGESKN